MTKDALVELLAGKKSEEDRKQIAIDFLKNNPEAFNLSDLKWVSVAADLHDAAKIIFLNNAFLHYNSHNITFENFSEILKIEGVGPVGIIQKIVSTTNASYSEYSQLLKIATESLKGMIPNYALKAIIEKRPIALDGIIELLKGWENKDQIHIATYILEDFMPIDQDVLAAVLQECTSPDGGSKDARKAFLGLPCKNFTKEAYIDLCCPLFTKARPMTSGQERENSSRNENEWHVGRLEAFFAETEEVMKASWFLESVVVPFIRFENFENLERKTVVKLTTAFLGAKNAEIGPRALEAILKYYHDDRNPDPKFYFQKTVESLFAVMRNDKITAEELKTVLGNLRGGEDNGCEVAKALLRENERASGKKITAEMVRVLQEMPRPEVDLAASSVHALDDRGDRNKGGSLSPS